MFCYQIAVKFYLFVAGMSTKLKKINIDYSEYLGPDYKETQEDGKRTSTMVCNHVSWLDTVILIKNLSPAFAPSSELGRLPVLSTLMEALDSIYIPRGGNEESRLNAL